jgi:hypothetical protein
MVINPLLILSLFSADHFVDCKDFKLLLSRVIVLVEIVKSIIVWSENTGILKSEMLHV